jgi:hypothetical protein
MNFVNVCRHQPLSQEMVTQSVNWFTYNTVTWVKLF